MKALVLIFSMLEILGICFLVYGLTETMTTIGYILLLTSVILREAFLFELLDKIKERKK